MVRNNTRMEKTGTKENIYIFQSDNLRPGCYWFGQLETILCLTQVRFALLGCSSQQALTHAAKEKEKNPHYTSTDRTQDNATPEIRSIFLTHLTSDKKRQSPSSLRACCLPDWHEHINLERLSQSFSTSISLAPYSTRMHIKFRTCNRALPLKSVIFFLSGGETRAHASVL